MNIDDLTLGQIKQIQSLVGGTQLESGSLNDMVGEKCIIRTYSAGVWFGKVDKKSGKEVIISNARRINYFKTVKGISLSSVANNGVHADSRIAEPVNKQWLEAIELIPCTDVAIKSLEEHDNE